MKLLSRSKDVSWRRIQVVTALLVGLSGLVGCGSQGAPGNPWEGAQALAEKLKISTNQLEDWQPVHR